MNTIDGSLLITCQTGCCRSLQIDRRIINDHKRSTMIRLRLIRYLLFLLITLLFFVPFLTIYFQLYSNSCTCKNEHSNPSNATRYDKYCDQLNQRIRTERISHTAIQLDHRKSIPYFYSQWRSTSLMPRVLTPCEHAIYMDLLSILIEHVFKKHKIQYMMMAATLLGSYTRHDLLPWDDDVDIRVSIRDRYRLQSIILGELSTEPYSLVLMEMHNKRNYDKVFFSWCPHFSSVAWRFPFVDIFYHDYNSTHVWLVGKPSSCPVRHGEIFPLVLRPLGSLWLYAPREPMAHFEARNMTDIETACYAVPYSHKYERTMRVDLLDVDCTKLKAFYPYVERRCTNKLCIEELKLGDNTTIQTLVYDYAYRTFLYSEKNSSYQAC